MDYSKNKITEPLLQKLLELAKQRGVEQARDLMFRGAKVNQEENKAVLPNVLRDANPNSAHSKNQVIVDNFNVLNDCKGELNAGLILRQALVMKNVEMGSWFMVDGIVWRWPRGQWIVPSFVQAQIASCMLLPNGDGIPKHKIG